jgi:DNA-binding transcriptional regulator WhiA
MTVEEPAKQYHQALHAANEQRTMEASSRNRKLAATALMRLGEDCPAEWEEVATELILHSECSWSEIARRLGVTRGQVVYRFRRLLTAAGVGDSSTARPDVPGLS